MSAQGVLGAWVEVAVADLPGAVAAREAEGGPTAADPVRWVWEDTSRWYPALLRAGVRVSRCHDLRLCHTILRRSLLTAGSTLAMAPPGPWDVPRSSPPPPEEHTLFSALADDGPHGSGAGPAGVPQAFAQGAELTSASESASEPAGPGGAVRAGDLLRGDAARVGDLLPGDAVRAGDLLPGDAVRASDLFRGDAARADDLLRDDAGRSQGVSPDVVSELLAQLEAVAGAADPGRLRLLLAAESTGALLAAEMHHDGMPWDVAIHDSLLTDLLGPRPRGGGRPAKLEALAEEVRAALGQAHVSLDSQPHLLRSLRAAGLDVTSTRTYELRAQDHPVVAPLLAYKKLARLLSANGWTWMETWVHDGRFRPDYVPGGVVTGRWATSGGGALQLPASIRGAVRADPGWRLVVADAAQLEPRVLAAMSGDLAMAAAGRHADLYQGLVEQGTVETRQDAKYAMLGAIYGATTGASAALMPRLTRAFPQAIAYVEAAARAGERGESVSTWLGRSSPQPGAAWREAREAAGGEGAEPGDARAARQRARDWGRFTRNFVVQGTAAEWALCWMAALRRRLVEVPGRPHLVFFLHDEVMVHAPAEVADRVAEDVRRAAAEAGRLLFGGFPIEFPLQVGIAETYADAK